MALLNYTTKVSASRTASEVQDLLAAAGARSVMLTYGDSGVATGLQFTIMTPAGVRPFSLPVNAEKVKKVLSNPRLRSEARSPGQHERVAWRILKDWVEAQLAIVETEMVSLDQIMLPFMAIDNAGNTVYELYAQQQLQLGASK